MIRCSVNNDIEGIILLWREAFGDARNEIEFFLNNKFIPENTVVCEENGKIISLLFLLNGEMHIRNQDYPAYYLYAACTSKKHRGKGIMGKMLDFSKQLAAGRGVDYICLMPAEKSLFEYYSKFGYMPIFNRKTVKINIEELNKISVTTPNFTDYSFKPLNRLRNEAFYNTNYFIWDKASVDFAIEHTKFYGGNAFVTNKGYCLYSVSNKTLVVKETTFTDKMLCYYLNKIVSLTHAQEIEINLPVNFDFFSFKSEVNYNGMILSTRNNQTTIENAYLGLTLD